MSYRGFDPYEEGRKLWQEAMYPPNLEPVPIPLYIETPEEARLIDEQLAKVRAALKSELLSDEDRGCDSGSSAPRVEAMDARWTNRLSTNEESVAHIAALERIDYTKGGITQ